MKKAIHPIYKDYPEQPYISPERDLELWVNQPELFPYGIIEKKNMIRIPEGLLPGDIIMLWRIGFDNFTNTTVIPQYFEYKYGIDSDESIATLIKLGYVEEGNAVETLDLLSMVVLKRMLKENSLPVGGKKDDLLKRVLDNIPEEELEKMFTLRKYKITTSGRDLLKKYDDVIQKHGPKM